MLIDQAGGVEDRSNKLCDVDMCFYYLRGCCHPHVIDSQKDVVVNQVLIALALMALSDKKISFVLRDCNMSNLIYIVRDGYECNCVLSCLCVPYCDLMA